jgi:serine/threonine-protein kinase HipA
MARPRTHTPLDVFLNGRLVGLLARQPGGAVDFQYDTDWLAWKNAMPVSLSLPLREDRYSGAPVVAVFDNLLPDNDEIRRRLAARVHAEGTDAYSLLAAIGRDCVGALQFLPQGTQPGPAGQIEGRAVSDKEITQILADLATTPLGVTDANEFRISIAGAQEKTALLFWKRRWRIPHGSTATTHILKPPIGKRSNLDLSESVENEHFCMRLAAALGLPVAQTEIVNFGGPPTLVVERFDRLWARDGRLLRLPQEDCCQALSYPPTRKYESEGGPGMVEILQLLRGSDNPEHDQKNFLKAQIVFWLLAAIDGHAKNFSIHLSPGGRYRMAPLYDVMSAQPNFDAGQIQKKNMRLAMAVGTNKHYRIYEIAPRHFIQTAEACGVPAKVVQGIFDELIAQTSKAIEQVEKEDGSRVPKKMVQSIKKSVLARLAQIEPAKK